MPRKVCREGIELICRFEGFSPKVYVCPAGYPTIGYGHVVLPHEKALFAGGITKQEAESILQMDVRKAAAAVERLITVTLNDYQFAALVSFTFNLGSGALQRSSLRTKLNRGEYAAISPEFMRWVWAGGRKMAGLIKRRDAEAALFERVVAAQSSELPPVMPVSDSLTAQLKAFFNPKSPA